MQRALRWLAVVDSQGHASTAQAMKVEVSRIGPAVVISVAGVIIGAISALWLARPSRTTVEA
jgi:hypothetical protein